MNTTENSSTLTPTAAAPASPKWHRLVNATKNNIVAETERAIRLTVPKTDFEVWLPKKLVRQFPNWQITVSVASDMTLKLQKMGKGKWNRRTAVEEKTMTGDQFAAYWDANSPQPKADVQETSSD
ncbi:hypothetical protein DB347_17745 [Opitutaceae bacterium EW11]|nr:hypothetical protein DB347_17745 [Opitutaceae bacterium EW11]